MTNVAVYYKMFLPGGHHRQPRNTSVDLSLAPMAGGDVPPMGVEIPPFFPQLPYTLMGGSGLANLVFWSVTDGTNGQVLPPTAITQTVGTSPLTITAWYYPTSGPGVGDGGPGIIDDAFSANLGQFIDDTFVNVTSDPSLTGNANVVGFVPTSSAETLVAYNTVMSTPEPFSKWILNGTFMVTGNTTLNVPQDTLGIAIAVYQNSSTRFKIPSVPSAYNPWWWIETHGGLVPPGPGDPWAQQLAGALAMATTASQVAPQLQGRALEVALLQLRIAAATLEKQIQGLQQG